MVVEVEDNAFHEHTTCTLGMEAGTQDVEVHDQLGGASCAQDELYTCVDDGALDNMTLA